MSKLPVDPWRMHSRIIEATSIQRHIHICIAAPGFQIDVLASNDMYILLKWFEIIRALEHICPGMT